MQHEIIHLNLPQNTLRINLTQSSVVFIITAEKLVYIKEANMYTGQTEIFSLSWSYRKLIRRLSIIFARL